MRTTRRASRLVRLPLALCATTMVLALTSCEDHLTAPKLRPTDPSFDIDVTPGSMALQVTMDGAPLGGFGSDYCPFALYMDRSPQTGWGQWVRWVCTDANGALAAVVPNLPTGEHTFDLRFYGQPILSEEMAPIVATTVVTLSATTQVPGMFEVRETLGLVEGTFTVNGQPVAGPFRYSVCVATSDQIAPCTGAAASTGAYRFLDRPGSRSAFVRGGFQNNFNPGSPISYFHYDVAAGATTTVPALDVVTSSLALQLTFNSQPVSQLGVSLNVCPFSLHIDRPANTEPWYFGPRVSWICGGVLTGQFPLADQPVGSHTFDLRFEGPTVTPSEQRELVGQAQLTLSAQQQATASFELGGRMGLVKGRLTINGNPAGSPYAICLPFQFGGWSACVFPDPTGAFAYFDLTGERTAIVRRFDQSQATLSSFTYTVEPGATLDLGDVAGDRAPLELHFKFDGVPLDGLGAGFANWNCPFALYTGGSGDPFNFGTFVQSVCADESGSLARVPIVTLPPGEHTIQLRFNGPPAMLGQPTPIVFNGSVTIQPGATATQVVELKDHMGLVTGTLKINGEVPPAERRFQICTRWPQGFWGACAWVHPDGIFKYVDIPGARSGLVKVYENSVEISNFGYTVVAGQVTVVGTTTGGAAGETPTGSNVTVTPVESNTGTTPVTLRFTNVTIAGLTTVSASGEVIVLPPPDADPVTLYYEIATTAVFAGPIQVCINYPGDVEHPERLQLQHYENGQWVNVTTALDLEQGFVCGEVTSLSPFVLVLPRNVAPVVTMPPGVTLIDNETFTAAGTFVDPDPDSWTATVSYGEGAVAPLTLTGKTFALSHTYRTPGQFSVAVTVTDDAGESGGGTALVIVLSHQDALRALIASLGDVVAASERNALIQPLEAAIAQLGRANYGTAIEQIGAFINQVGALVNSDRLTGAQGTGLTDQARRVIRAVQLE